MKLSLKKRIIKFTIVIIFSLTLIQIISPKSFSLPDTLEDKCLKEIYSKEFNKKVCVLYYIGFSFEKTEEVRKLDHKYYIKEGLSLYCLENKCNIKLELYLQSTSNPENIIKLVDKEFTLKYNEIRNVYTEFNINELNFTPGEYVIILRLKYDNKSIEFRGNKINIERIVKIEKKVKKVESLIGKVVKILVVNKGNDVYYGNITIEIPTIDKILGIKTNYKYKIEDNKLVFLDIKINKNEKVELEYKVSYLFFYLLPIILIILAFIYSILTSKVYIERVISKIEEKEDKLKLNIMIKIFNNKENMKDVRIVENLPKDAKVLSVFPKNAVINNLENKIVWVLEELKIGEIVILNYEIELNKREVIEFEKLTIHYENYIGQTKKVELRKEIIKVYGK